MSRALLDVNVLLALLDADHVGHDRAREWLKGDISYGWASCAITQNGFVRIISQPKYPNAVSPATAIGLLARATTTEYHDYWPCDVSLVERSRLDPARVYGSKQVTDAYLLSLAVAHEGRFVTFDRKVSVNTVPDAETSHLVVL